MRLFEITQADPFLYHMTRTEKLPAVTQDGLTPNIDRDPTFDGYPVDGRLFVATSYDSAMWYAQQFIDSGDYEPHEFVVLRFPKKGVRTRTDPYGNGPGDRFTMQSIPPELLEVYQNGEWRSLNRR